MIVMNASTSRILILMYPGLKVNININIELEENTFVCPTLGNKNTAFTTSFGGNCIDIHVQ